MLHDSVFGSKPVAVKMLSEVDAEAARHELRLHQALEHPNIVRCLTYCWAADPEEPQADKKLCVVTELMSDNLYSHLARDEYHPGPW